MLVTLLRGWTSRLLLALVPLLCVPLVATQAGTARTVEQIVDTYAGDAVRTGQTAGVGVGIVYPGHPPRSFGFGYANAALKTPFTGDTLAELGSTAKVFTTNLLGQAVANGTLSLATPLSQFPTQLGKLRPLAGRITLGELGDFTAGLPVFPPLCSEESVTGCMPYIFPSMHDYTAVDFVRFIRNVPLLNYSVVPPLPASRLPGASYYSSTSTSLLGLLLATPTGSIRNGSVDAWYDLVRDEILAPLGMNSTFLRVPTTIPASRIAAGYQQAGAQAVVADGKITRIRVTNFGANYGTSPPPVSIVGGGGSGATATATVQAGQVAAIDVQSQGQGYLAAPVVTFSAGTPKTPARGIAIVADGRVTGIHVIDGGDGYDAAPAVTIAGGRTAGTDATAIAHIAHGSVTLVTIADGGSGYAVPLAVVVGPGRPEHSAVGFWAPSGLLISSAADLATLMAAALGNTTIAGHPVPDALTRGFKIAEAEYACLGPDPRLANCPADRNRVGLSWAIHSPDVANGSPRLLSKAGGLRGFSSQIVLIPEKRIGVVVVVNSNLEHPAATLSFQIAYALYDALTK